MRKGIWILIMITIIVVIIFWAAGGYRIKDVAPYYLKKIIGETATVTIKDEVVKAEVARTAKARERGLSGRESLESDRGMLFVFPSIDIYPFTMENTLIQLDIIWILDDRVVYIARQAQPGEELINPETRANYVLEVDRGTAENWQVGDEVSITFDK